MKRHNVLWIALSRLQIKVSFISVSAPKTQTLLFVASSQEKNGYTKQKAFNKIQNFGECYLLNVNVNIMTYLSAIDDLTFAAVASRWMARQQFV